jgi:putative oxygen-independent coproporphyrinogen III oxidase
VTFAADVETAIANDDRVRGGAGIYVHVPFCVTRCGYCDFNAYEGLDALKPAYVAALHRELDLVATDRAGESVSSIFFGGGTPSTLAPDELRDLLTSIRGRFHVRPSAEVTMEANPETVSVERLVAARSAGFDRLSMGAQSFDASVLATLERTHSPDGVAAAVRAAREAGFENVNLDLIYGADGETIESWARTLEEAVALGPEHISAYALTIESATPLGRRVSAGLTPAPDPDLQADMFELACDALAAAGFGHYEVSNWARAGFECRHNLGYWERRPCVGIGAGAHSSSGRRRWWNVRRPEAYLDMVARGERPIAGGEELAAEDERLEEIFLRMRTRRGVPSSWVADEQRLAPLLGDGLVVRRNGSIVPTERGLLLLNELVLALSG